MAKAAKSAHLSKSKWIAKLIKEKIVNDWPDSVTELAGAWHVFQRLRKCVLTLERMLSARVYSVHP